MKPRLEEQYIATGRVKLVWHDFAWLGEESLLAAQAARCAGRQDRFWDYHDHLYNNQRGANQGQFSRPNLKRFAAELHLDQASFDDCLDRGDDLAAIQEGTETARTQGVLGTPFFVLGDRRIVGALPLETFQQLLDEALASGG